MSKKTVSGMRVIVAAVVGLVCCVAIWTLVPYNNFLFDNTYLADSYLPECVIGLLLLIVLVLNPMLRLLGKKWMLNRRQIALIASLMIFAAIIPSNGLMRMFPRFVAQMSIDMNSRLATSKVAAEAGFRQALFPDPLPEKNEDGTVKTYDTPVSDQFIDELDEGASIPWKAWVLPMASWGMLIMALWIMMVGLAGIVYPQWKEKERLPFPLLHVYQAVIGDPDNRSGRVLPEIFYSRSFWVAVITVFFIHMFRGLDVFTKAFPSFPLSWDIGRYYTDGIMRHAPVPFRRQSIYFFLVGVAYFMPNRYSISVWGWVYLASWYLTLGRAYIPAFNEGQIDTVSGGALFAIAVWVLWLGRSQWAQVGRAMFGKAGNDEEAHRNAVAGWIFMLGCTGLIFWLYWAGCALWWCVVATFGCAVVAIVMARIIAETGIPVLWTSRISVSHFTRMFPLAWLSPAIMLFDGAFYAILTRATAVNAAVMSTLAFGVDSKGKPAHQGRIAVGGIIVLLIGFTVCGAVHLKMGYSSADVTTNPKTSANKIDAWSRVDQSSYNFFDKERGSQAIGLVMGLGLLWACSRFPSWPLHPVGIVLCRYSLGNLIWFSVFLGWLLKTAITRLFGGGAYRRARPFFLGLILGELLAVIVWAIVPLVIVWATGADPSDVPRYMLMRYP